MLASNRLAPFLANFIFFTASMLLIFIGVALFLGTGLFFAGYSLSEWVIPGAALMSLVATLYCSGKFLPRNRQNSSFDWRLVGAAVLCALLLFSFCLVIGGSLMDTTVDGQVYHASGIIHLAEGWNPVRGEPLSTDMNRNNLYVNSYPKGAWIIAALVYKATGRIEMGKGVNLLLLIVSIGFTLVTLIWLACCRKISISFGSTALLSCLAALNPVVVTQLFSYYIDGQVASLLLIFCDLCILWFVRPGRLSSLALIVTILLIVNLKFTGTIYILLVGLVMVVYSQVRKRNRSILGVYLIAFCLGVGFVGYNPYITNTIKTGNPFFPISNPLGATDKVIEINLPENFRSMNSLGKLFLSIFSQSQLGLEATQLKIPLTFKGSELAIFQWPDVRVAGFGPLFSGILLFSFFWVAWTWFSRIRRYMRWKPIEVEDRIPYTGMIEWLRHPSLVALLLVTVLVNPEAWWARLAPQLWFFPLIVIICLWPPRTQKIGQAFVWIMIGVIVLNLGLISSAYFPGQFAHTKEVDEVLQPASQLNQTYWVDFSIYEINRVRLAEFGIKYKELKVFPWCAEIIQVPYSETRLCLPIYEGGFAQALEETGSTDHTDQPAVQIGSEP